MLTQRLTLHPPGCRRVSLPLSRAAASAAGHLQTIVGNFLPRPAFRLAAVSEPVEVDPVVAAVCSAIVTGSRRPFVPSG